MNRRSLQLKSPKRDGLLAFVIGLPMIMHAIRRVKNVKSRFNTEKEHRGSIAAIVNIIRFLFRYVIARVFRLMRTFSRIEDLVALLPLPNLGMCPEVLFIGYLEAGLGLGESLRGLVRSVAATGIPFALYPYKVGVETRLIGGFMQDRYDLKRRHKINVIEMSADQVPGMFREIGRWKTGHSYNILRTYWELQQAPAVWASMIKGIQEIWVPNEFVGNAFRAIFDGPITIVPPCVDVEIKDILDKEYFQLDRDRFYFMFSFDYYSYPARKNPLCVMESFQSAFPDLGERVGLIIKSSGMTSRHLAIKSEIEEMARRDHRIKVIDTIFSREEMLSLICQSDCFVSLHRSEGFGLGMAEAMALGKPVIGTDYSGNTDFLSDHTGFPVSFTLRSVRSGEYIFAEGQSWAEPDNVSAVEAMQSVFYDRPEAMRRAEAGKAFVESHYGKKNVGRIAVQQLQKIGTYRYNSAVEFSQKWSSS